MHRLRNSENIKERRNTFGLWSKGLLLFLMFFMVFSYVSAQNDMEKPSVFSDDLLLTEINPLHPFGIFAFNTPFYFGTFKSNGSRFTVGYSFANVWHPQSTVFYPQNLTPAQTREVNSMYITDRPEYFEEQGIETRQKTFSTDGVLQSLSFTYLKQFARKGSLILKLNTHALAGGSFPLHYLASDKFIEKFHTWVDLEDNFGRKLFDFNRAQVSYQDENGRTINLSKGNVFAGTFETHYYHSLWKIDRRASYLSMQSGAHLILPLNRYYPEVSGGLSTSLLFRKKIASRLYTDLAADFSASHYSLVSLGKSPNLIDRDIRLEGKTYLTINLVSKRNRVFSFGLLNNYHDAFLKGYIFVDTQDKYKNLGVSYLKSGEKWNGKTITEPVRLSKLTAASMYFFSIESFFFWNFKGKKSDFMFTMAEDYLVVNNAPDIQFGLQYTRRFGW